MSDIVINIDGKKCEAKEGETILNIARREEIFIPAICYLNECSPTLACRICLVEADNKRVYACNAKAKDGMDVVINNDEIQEERKAIMQVYDVNHPLQCGVCDKSGECELQDYTLMMNVDTQEFKVADTFRPVHDWGLIKYDTGLCIVCEKCVTVCKDRVGDSVLQTVKRGGDSVSKDYKDSMPKDAYTIWNKLQKSLIGTTNEDNTLDCQSCGECIEVCPVGALVSSDFQYTANAWELKKIPAANPHSSDCTFMYYEVKNDKIHRVTNESNYAPLSGSTRFGYDFENKVSGKDRASFEKAVHFIQNDADTIMFNSFITNEEAYILQQLKEKFSLKLINDDARRYKLFLENFKKASGKSLYSSSLKSIKASDFFITVGTHLRSDAPIVGFAVNNGLKMNKGALMYFHPLGDSVVEGYTKTYMSIQHKVAAEEHILAFILDYFSSKAKDLHQAELNAREKEIEKAKKKELEIPVFEELEGPVELAKEIKDVVSTYDKGLLNLDENYEKVLDKMLGKKENFTLIVGEDLYTHQRSENLGKILGLIEKYTMFDVMIIPSQTNTLGVSLICDLDEEAGDKVLGYNENGNFKLSALGDGDLDMAALNQQEGTFTNMDKRVVPTNVAVTYSGYVLNDLANALGLNEKYTINYTDKLPQSAGFEPLEFDLMPNFYDNGGNELRGYLMSINDIDSSDEVDNLQKVETKDEAVVYRSNPINQFSYFTNSAHQLKSKGGVYVSGDFLEANDLGEGDEVEVVSDSGKVKAKLALDTKLKGEIIYLGTFDKKLDCAALFDNSRYSTVTIQKV